MATRRMLPTKFFKDPDVMALSNSDIRLILIGLVLYADDEGRELAHAKLLGRELDYDPEVIEQALSELETNDFICCYSVGKHRYYSLCRWNEWETLSKPTSSKYPPPPPKYNVDESKDTPTSPQNSLGNPGDKRELFSEGEDEGEGRQKDEGKRNEDADEISHQHTNVVLFPSSHVSNTSDNQKRQAMITQVASILKLTENEALARIVEEYMCDPALSLLGEADAAREYIDDRQRNRHGTRMTPAFFRRWLKREHDQSLQRQSAVSSSQSREGKEDALPSRAKMPPSLMNLEAHYQGEMDRQERAKA